MFCCPLSQSGNDLLHIHMYTCVETMHSSLRGHVIHHLCCCCKCEPVLGLCLLLDTNEIILCKYAASRARKWYYLVLLVLCLIPHIITVTMSRPVEVYIFFIWLYLVFFLYGHLSSSIKPAAFAVERAVS